MSISTDSKYVVPLIRSTDLVCPLRYLLSTLDLNTLWENKYMSDHVDFAVNFTITAVSKNEVRLKMMLDYGDIGLWRCCFTAKNVGLRRYRTMEMYFYG